MKTLFFMIMALSIAYSCAAEEEARGGGLFSEGSFLSEAISSATDKLSNVTSGKEKIVDNDAKGMDKDILEYDRDPLGRSKAALANDDFRNYRKSNEERYKKDSE